jgi:hypothetical protein
MDLVESVDEKFEITWPDGDETWFIHRELPQRNQFILEKQPVMSIGSTIHLVEEPVQEMLVDGNCAVPPIVHKSNEIQLLREQNQANYNAPNTEIELSMEVETDHCESIQKFAADPLYDEISPRIIEVECQEPKHPIQFHLYQHGSESKVARHPAATVRNLPVMLPIEDQLYTFSRTHETEISSHVLKSPIRRSYSKYISPSRTSWCFQSPVSFYGRRYYQFLPSITTHLISWWLVLFTILLGTETAHYLHDDLHCSETRSLNVNYIFLLALLSLVSRTITLTTLEPFVKTIEILRNLETLLIYGIT